MFYQLLLKELALDSVGITVNKNMIPYDPQKPMTTSGIRVGSPAVTTRGFGAPEMTQVAKLIGKTMLHIGNEAIYEEVRAEVSALSARFPVPGIAA